MSTYEAIRTERLVLEPGLPAHAAEVFEATVASQAELARWMAWAAHPTLQESEAFYLVVAQRGEAGAAFHFVIRAAGGGPVLGTVEVRRDAARGGLGEMGYWMRTDHSGRGLMTEAAAAAREFGFQMLGLRRIELRAGVENHGSRRVAEKIGMRREGLARGAAISATGYYDCHIFGMLSGDARRDTGGTALRVGPPRPTEVGGTGAGAAAPDFSRGLITAVAQDVADGTVLMVAHMDAAAYAKTRETGHAWFWSRSRARLWEKGETSGNYLDVVGLTVDCDDDAVLLEVSPHGPACHTGARSCFHRRVP